MRLPRETHQVQQTIETHLPHLSQPQLAGLVPVSSTGQALWVCGAILAGSACQNAVASALSPWRSWNNLRQYLREWLYDGSDRARPCQTQLDVTLCFAPRLRWVLTWWVSGRLAVAIDPTLNGDQTTAIVISVLYRGCAIPVAWSIHRATQKGSWMDPTVPNPRPGWYGIRGRIPEYEPLAVWVPFGAGQNLGAAVYGAPFSPATSSAPGRLAYAPASWPPAHRPTAGLPGSRPVGAVRQWSPAVPR